jgi:hypothetical protein
MRLALLLSVLVCLWFTGFALAVDAGDLVFYYAFDQVDGNVVPDQSGNGLNGDINGKIKLVDGGKFGKAAEFQSGDYIDVHGIDVPANLIPRNEITLCAWINLKNDGQDHAIFNAQSADQTWLVHPEAKSGGNFRWLLRSDGGTGIFDFTAGAVDWGNWQHYAGTYDGKKGTLYINGEVVGEANGSGKIAKDWNLGARVGKNIDDARPFAGLMDDINLWKAALTKDEIKTIMEKSAAVLIKGEAVSSIGNMTTTWGMLKSR